MCALHCLQLFEVCPSLLKGWIGLLWTVCVRVMKAEMAFQEQHANMKFCQCLEKSLASGVRWKGDMFYEGVFKGCHFKRASRFGESAMAAMKIEDFHECFQQLYWRWQNISITKATVCNAWWYQYTISTEKNVSELFDPSSRLPCKRDCLFLYLIKEQNTAKQCSPLLL